MAEKSIVVENLTCSYGKLSAVDHISFDVEAERFLGFLGPNSTGHLLAGNLDRNRAKLTTRP